MKYHLTLRVADPVGRLAKALATEVKAHDRSAMQIARKGKQLTITITASDAVALKASVHTVVQLLAVDEQMEGVAHGR